MVQPNPAGRGLPHCRSFLFADFLDNLKRQGYAVKTGKYIAVRPPGKERFVRLKAAFDNDNEIEILTDQRREIHRQKYKNPKSEEISQKIASVNQSIKMYRHELKICAQIETDIPTLRQTFQTPAIETPEKRSRRSSASSTHTTDNGICPCMRCPTAIEITAGRFFSKFSKPSDFFLCESFWEPPALLVVFFSQQVKTTG